MKIFISHQRADSTLAANVAARLRSEHQIDCYLDVVDTSTSKGDELGDYIREQLGKCTQLLAVVSTNTKASWWVPWEIGVATEKDQPIATYAGDSTSLPEYLMKWPYLRTDSDLDKYAEATKASNQTYRAKRGYLEEAVSRRSSTQEFYRVLRASLRQ